MELQDLTTHPRRTKCPEKGLWLVYHIIYHIGIVVGHGIWHQFRGSCGLSGRGAY